MHDLIQFLYWYCTDFCVNAANLLGWNYEVFNAVLFVFLMPLTLVLLLVLNLYRYLFRKN